MKDDLRHAEHQNTLEEGRGRYLCIDMRMVCFSAVWYDQTSYPTSWQLDPTEGPNRERRRLQRCYLTIPNKYLLKDRRKPEGEETLFTFRNMGKFCRVRVCLSPSLFLI